MHPKLRLFSAFAVLSLCTACASSLEKVTGWLSSNADAMALDGQRVLLGKMNFAAEREATLQVQGKSEPALSCSGKLRYTATTTGTITVACSDGRTGLLSFAAISAVSGTASGLLGMQPFKLSYGLVPDKAAGFLGVAPERLVEPKAPAAAAASPSY